MKIAIIGGGWVGCHLAKKLISEHKVTIYDTNKKLFEESSYKNQNRLHLGYHYSRSFNTRDLSKNTFQKFIDEYEFLITDVPNNIYCVPYKKSLIDFKTFLKIFDDYDHEIFEHKDLNVEGCIKTNEKHINFKKAKDYFNDLLKDNFVSKKINKNEISDLKNNFDLIINCTNNFIRNENDIDSFYEVTISFLYELKNKINFGALTLVDGPLFSIYPYNNNLYTLTDVEYTPIKKFKDVNEINEFTKKLNDQTKNKIRKKMEKKVKSYYPKFNNVFSYKDYFISIKSKKPNSSDDRSPIITTEEKIINIFTGKIQGIYLIEDFVKNFIKHGKTSA